MQKSHRFLIDAGGIFLFYFYFGILQEKVTKSKYSYVTIEDDGTQTTATEKFTYPLVLVFTLCAINYLLAKIFLKVQHYEEDKTPQIYNASVAVTYLLAMVCSNMALQWVAYPTQVVGKAAKPIPVLLLGVLLGKKSHALKKYLFVSLIVIGVVLFMYKERNEGGSKQDVVFGIGELLLFLSLTMDGLTGAVQERIRAKASPSGPQMMASSNMWSTLFLAVAVLVTGEAFAFLEFAKRHPQIISNLLILGVTQGIGQIFLYSMVSHFGPLSVSIVTTTRKFFTVLGSVIIFGNTLTSRQWLGAVIVFAGLFLDIYFSKKGGAPPTKPAANKS